jgi:hypothetical protein
MLVVLVQTRMNSAGLPPDNGAPYARPGAAFALVVTVTWVVDALWTKAW